MLIPKYVEEIIYKLYDAGYESYLVGGAVRDIFLGLSPSDFDITTKARPCEIESVFNDYPTISIGKEFGTILVIYKGEEIEITTFRADGKYVDGRRPENVTFSDELVEDLKRRDFTINSLAYNKKEGIIDYFNGIDDIKLGVIRTVGNPKERFNEDYLRILRCLRFSAQLNFKIEKETYLECKRQSENIEKISNERIRDELFKILLSDNPSLGIELLRKTGILEIILPELYETIGFDQNNPYHDKDVYHHTLMVLDNTPKKLEIRLAAIFHDLGKIHTYTEDDFGIGHFYGHEKESKEIAINILKRFNTSKKLIDRVSNLVDKHMINNSQFKSKGIKRLINKLGKDNIFDLMELQKADRKSTYLNNRDISDILDMEKEIENILLREEVYDKKELAIDGNHVIELGCKEGKIIGEILDFAYEIVLENSDLNNKEYLINKIKEEYKLEEK